MRPLFLKKYFFCCLFCFGFIPFVSSAVGPGAVAPGLPFGGFVVFSVPCACSLNDYIFFTPLSPNPPLPKAGALLYQPLFTTVYSYFALGIPGTWHLGSYIPYIPGAPGACWEIVGTACAPMPYFGIMNQVGTGFLP